MTNSKIFGTVTLRAKAAATGGGAFSGALIDSLAHSFAFNQIATATTIYGGTTNYTLDNTVYDTDGYVSTADGTGDYLDVGDQVLVTPSAGVYDIDLFVVLFATGTEFSWECGIHRDKQGVAGVSGSYAEQAEDWLGVSGWYAGRTNSNSQKGAAHLRLTGFPCEADETFTWSIQQHSGADRTIGYVRFGIHRLGDTP